ncbi:MAG: alanine--tRNA ligase, partial [Alphaproteobacteria bacterium]|nr:alanine--tRNA ligase [Alphaproteobacteria bacterium]
VPFKNYFTGAAKPPFPRAATSQKCVRAGGKHNDLDNVGYTARHHTFFEMLGNFSFGDYFKDLAIELAWNLVTKEYGLPREKLWVTVYHEDEEAFGLWKKIAGLPDERIVRIATSDNFWAMGDTGPCGPCSEIFYDHGPGIPGGPPGSADADGDRYVEIWNLVFMQFEQVSRDERIPLPKPSIDTGMGLERIAAVMQGKHDNYDTDLLRSLIEASAEASGAAPDGPHAVSHRVIADHLRASSFLIADGVLPANEGRGYVLRRIMRRAMRHAQMLGAREPLMWKLVPALSAMMGRTYPELLRAESLIQETLKLEETRFRQTLERGLRLLDEELGRLSPSQKLPGEVAFRLYDTYGFPLDLTQDALRARGREVDVQGFSEAMARQKEEARRAWAGSGEAATEAVWFEIREAVGASEFLGYETEVAEGRVEAIVVDGRRTGEAPAGARASVVLNQTCFYGESGGQVGDTGAIFTAQGVELRVLDTQKKLGELHVHVGEVHGGTLKVGDLVEIRVDGRRRASVRANHSATHILHAALRRRLGDHVTQKGSLVAPDRLRFDFSHPKPVSEQELADIEAEVNRVIRQNADVATRLMTPDSAIEAGALALFGEKYGEEVRVVTMGIEDAERAFSTELCGGTHVRRTGDIALFRIVSEAGVAAGVRRVEALTGEAARLYMIEQERSLREAANALKAPPAEVAARVRQLIEERRRLERELSEARQRAATGGGVAARKLGDVSFVAQSLEGVPAKDLRGMIDAIKKQAENSVVALVSVSDDKAALVVGVADGLTGRVNAVDLVRVGAAELGGKGGGGRPEFAQAGGPDGARAKSALEAIEKALIERIGA